MQVQTLFSFIRGQLAACALCGVVTAISGTAVAQERAEQKDIRSEIEGDTQCIVSATRWWLTWKQYNDAKDQAFQDGDQVDQETMYWYADTERRTSWRVPEYTPSISFASGRVDGEENTRYGAIPNGADIQVGYLHDWKVVGEYGWGSRKQPRVESITEIQIDPDFEAIIEVTNDIDFTGKASLSGTAGRTPAWPQVAKHDVTLLAIDINGQQHRVRGRANATVTPTNSSSETDGSSSTTSWSINGSVGVSGSGPSGSIGGSYGQSTTESHSTTSGQLIPTVPDQSYGEEMQYHNTTSRTFKVPCGGTVRFTRAAQISGHFFTRSMASHGSVSSKGNFAVSNTVKIRVTCIPCGEGGDAEGDPQSDPSGGDNPGGDNSGGDNSGGDNSGGDNSGGKRTGSLDPLERDGVTYTPSFGGSHYPRDFWDNPIIRAGGCIYIDPRQSFDRFLPIPESEAHDVDPWFFEQNGRIPLVVPDHNEWTYVAAAHTPEHVILRPFPGTGASVLLGLNRVEFDGPFMVVDPASGGTHQFGRGFVEFAVGGAAQVEGTYQLRLLPGDQLQTRVEGSRQILETFNQESELPTSVVVLDEQVPGVIIFERSVYMPDAPEAEPLVETPDTEEPPVEDPRTDSSPLFKRADPNGDGATDISDAVWLLKWFFGDGGAPACQKSADANGDGALDVSDTIYILLFLFGNGSPPPAPWASCGVAPDVPGMTGDLGCESYDACSE